MFKRSSNVTIANMLFMKIFPLACYTIKNSLTMASKLYFSNIEY